MPASPAPTGTRVLVIGVGNPLMSDDGVGAAPARGAGRRRPALDGVEYLDAGTLGFLLLPRIEQCVALLVLDAAHLDAAPGDGSRVSKATAIDEFLRTRRAAACTSSACATCSTSARLTGPLPARRALVGVQPLEVGWGDLLSTPVAAALPAAPMPRVRCCGWLAGCRTSAIANASAST